MLFPKRFRPASEFVPTDRIPIRRRVRQQQSEELRVAGKIIRDEASRLLGLADSPVQTEFFRASQPNPALIEVMRRNAQGGELVARIYTRPSRHGITLTDTSVYGYEDNRGKVREIHATVTDSNGRPEGIGFYEGRQRLTGDPTNKHATRILGIIFPDRVETVQELAFRTKEG